MFDFIAIPMGYTLKFIYDTLAFQNYGIAIILFTIIVKSLLLPLTIKQYQSTSKMSELHVFALYFISHVKKHGGKSEEVIGQLYEMIPEGSGRIAHMQDLSIITYFGKHPEELENVSHMLKIEELFNMNFLGINLGTIPAWSFSNFFNPDTDLHNLVLPLIPILAVSILYIRKILYVWDLSESDNQMQVSMQKNYGFNISGDERRCFFLYCACWAGPHGSLEIFISY
jgi:YidC/Oxa1 family membrane protein insertase